MLNSLEKISQEKEPVPEIIIRIFRHSIKEGERESDKTTHLTKEGRDLARGQYDPTLKNVLAFGSPTRERSQETAALMAFGSEAEDFTAIKEDVNQDLAYASRLGTDARLDFKNGEKTIYKQRLREEFYNHNFLKFLAEESDDFAKQYGNEQSATYSRMAGQIAKIINKYYLALDNWAEILQENPNKYDSLTLERFLGTHQGLGESFLAKAITKIAGQEERDNFIKALNNHGFDFTEGLMVDIKKEPSEKIINILFAKKLANGEKYNFTGNLTEAMLQEIIKEGNV